MYCNIVLDQLEHIDVCREITSLHFLVIETKHSDKFLSVSEILYDYDVIKFKDSSFPLAKFEETDYISPSIETNKIY